MGGKLQLGEEGLKSKEEETDKEKMRGCIKRGHREITKGHN